MYQAKSVFFFKEKYDEGNVSRETIVHSFCLKMFHVKHFYVILAEKNGKNILALDNFFLIMVCLDDLYILKMKKMRLRIVKGLVCDRKRIEHEIEII